MYTILTRAGHHVRIQTSTRVKVTSVSSDESLDAFIAKPDSWLICSGPSTPTMTNFRFVRFTNPDELLEALAQDDDSSMNFTLGALLDSMDETRIQLRRITSESRKLYVVYADDTLL